jgi:hypothetical protein
MCPQFDLLDEIYGTKISVSPPFVHDTHLSEISRSPELGDTETTETEASCPITSEQPEVHPKFTSNGSRSVDIGRKRKAQPYSGINALAASSK